MVRKQATRADQTVIVLPLLEGDAEGRAELIQDLENLGARTLLLPS
jgi:hypothetical protein